MLHLPKIIPSVFATLAVASARSVVITAGNPNGLSIENVGHATVLKFNQPANTQLWQLIEPAPPAGKEWGNGTGTFMIHQKIDPKSIVCHLEGTLGEGPLDVEWNFGECTGNANQPGWEVKQGVSLKCARPPSFVQC